MNLQTGTAAEPPFLVRVQKVVADNQLRPTESWTGLPAVKTARVHGDTLVDSLVASYMIKVLQKVTARAPGRGQPKNVDDVGGSVASACLAVAGQTSGKCEITGLTKPRGRAYGPRQAGTWTGENDTSVPFVKKMFRR